MQPQPQVQMGPQMLPPQLQPAPIPAAVNVRQILWNGREQVELIVNDASGERHIFFSPEAAEKVGSQMVAAGRAGKLILPAGTMMPTDFEPDVEPVAEAPQPNRQQRRQAEREARRAA